MKPKCPSCGGDYSDHSKHAMGVGPCIRCKRKRSGIIRLAMALWRPHWVKKDKEIADWLSRGGIRITTKGLEWQRARDLKLNGI